MKILPIIRIPILLLPLFIIACRNGSNSTSNNDGPLGELKGLVILYDSLGRVMKDCSGVTVTAEGTSYKAVTDQDGIWKIPNLPTRTYSFAFDKEGFSEMKNTSYKFVGGGVDYFGSINLQQEMKYRIVLDAVFLSTTDVGKIFFHYQSNSIAFDWIQCRVFFSRTPMVDPNDPNTYLTYVDESLYPDSITVDRHDELDSYRIKTVCSPGDTIFINSLSGYSKTFQSYFDAHSLKTVWTGLEVPSNTLSTIVQ